GARHPASPVARPAFPDRPAGGDEADLPRPDSPERRRPGDWTGTRSPDTTSGGTGEARHRDRVGPSVRRVPSAAPAAGRGEPGRFDAVVDSLFAHRRKTVENGLRLGWTAFARSREELEALLPSVPHRTRRVGELSPEEIARIAEAIPMAKG